MLVVGVAAAVVGAAVPGLGEASLFERNRAVLLASLPEGAVLEVWVGDGDGTGWQVWTAEEYASFRAGFAAQMGRDYAAPSAEGVPSGMGDQQYWGDIWSDLWGETRINADAGVCLPRAIPNSDKMWIYAGRCGFAENRNQCLLFGGVRVCSNSYGWFYPQGGSEHGDAWFAYSGSVYVFPPPFGAVAFFDGVLFAENL